MNRKIGTLWILVGLLASLSNAQTWRGAEAVGLQVNDAKGRAIPGARVVFTFQGIPGDLGPDIVATDTKGRAVVAELVPGPWKVEVIHPDYLSFIAMIDVRRGKKPQISASFLEAGGRSLNPVKVKLSKGDERQASPILEARAPAAPSKPEDSIAQEPSPPPVQVAEVPPPVSVPKEAPPPPEAAAPDTASEIVEEPEAEPLAPPTEPQPVMESPIPQPLAQEIEIEEPTPQPATDIEDVGEAGAEDLTSEAEPLAEPAVAAAAIPSAAQIAEAEPAIETAPEIDEPPTELLAPAEAAQIPEAEPAIETAAEVDEQPTELPVPAEEETRAVAETPAVPNPVDIPQPTVEPMPTEVPTPDPDEAPEAEDLIEERAPTEKPLVVAEPRREADAGAAEVAPRPLPTATAPSPPPAVAVSALAAPADTGAIVTSHRDGSCPGCQTAEWTLQVSAPVPAASPGSTGSCTSGVLEAARPAMQELASSIQLELQGFIGPLANGTEQAAIRHAESDLVAPFQGQLAAFVGGTSPCQLVGLVLPKEVRFSRVTYAASDQQGSGDCAPGQICSIGEAAWLGSARVRGPSATVIYGLFENRSGERARRAFMTAYYRPPSAKWEPRLPAAD